MIQCRVWPGPARGATYTGSAAIFEFSQLLLIVCILECGWFEGADVHVPFMIIINRINTFDRAYYRGYWVITITSA